MIGMLQNPNGAVCIVESIRDFPYNIYAFLGSNLGYNLNGFYSELKVDSTRKSRLPNQVFKHRREVVVGGVELGDIQLIFDEEFGKSRIESIRLGGFDNNIACCIYF